MDLLLNYSELRTGFYTEAISIPSDGIYKLKYIPKESTLSAYGFNIITSGTPSRIEALITYNAPNEYFQASGVLTFNPLCAGQNTTIQYIPIGSRVDADDLNPMLQWWDSTYKNLYVKNDFIAGGSAKVDWSVIYNSPGNATISKDGFLSFMDKRTILTVDPLKKPIGAIELDTETWAPTAWGGTLKILNTPSIKAVMDAGSLRLDVDPKLKGLVPDNVLEALAGTGGAPSKTNRYLTEGDDRFKGTSVPPHTHAESDVTDLLDDLLEKASGVHSHSISEINNLATELADKASKIHGHGMVDISGLGTALADKADRLHTHTSLENEIANKANETHQHHVADIADFAANIPHVAPGGGGSTMTTEELYRKLGNSMSMASVIEDYNVSGFDVTAGTDFMFNVSPGEQYAGGVRLVSSVSTSYSALASAGPIANVTTPVTPPTAYPIITGTCNVAYDLSLTFNIVQPNTVANSLADLGVDVIDGTGKRLGNLVYTSNNAQELLIAAVSTGLFLTFYIGEPMIYQTGYSWTTNYVTNKDVYVYLDGSVGSVRCIPVVKGAAAPATPATCSTLAKIVTSTTGIVSITPLKIQSGPPKLKDLKGITKAAGDSSSSLATTSFVSTCVNSRVPYKHDEERTISGNGTYTIAVDPSVDLYKVTTTLYTVDSATLVTPTLKPAKASVDPAAHTITISNDDAASQKLRIVIIGG